MRGRGEHLAMDGEEQRTYGNCSLVFCAPSQPKKTGRVLRPREMNSSVEFGKGLGRFMNPGGSMPTFVFVARSDCPFGLKSLVSPPYSIVQPVSGDHQGG